MPWKLTNVALDPAYAQKRRMASAARLEMEPVIAGNRLRLRQVVTISDRLYEANKTRITLFENMGVLKVEGQGSGPKKVEAPKPLSFPEPEVLPEPEPEPEPELEPPPVSFDWDDPPAEPDTEPATPKTKKSKKGKSKK